MWSTNNIEGVHRFLARVYRLITEQPVSNTAPSQPQMRLLHATIKKVMLAGRQCLTCLADVFLEHYKHYYTLETCLLAF